MRDEKTVRELGHTSQLPDSLDAEEFEIFTSVQLLWARVLNDALRAAIAALVNLCSDSSHLRDLRDLGREQQLERLSERQNRITSTYSAVNEILGELIRRELDRRHLALPTVAEITHVGSAEQLRPSIRRST